MSMFRYAIRNANTIPKRRDTPLNSQQLKISPDEYAELRNGSSRLVGWKDWGRLFMAVLVPLVGAVLWFSQTAFQAEQNKSDIVKHANWIEEHSRDTASIKQSVNDVERTQAVILEKFISIQKDIEQIAQRSQ